jgi:sortase A
LKIRRIIRIVAVLILLAGIGFLAYPYITQFFYEKDVEKIVESFEAQVQKRDPLLEKLYEIMVEENERLYENGQANLMDPFSYERTGLDLTEYGLTENIVGYLTIPKMDTILPIYLGASKANLDLGAVHLTQTSYPIGGPNTNCVIAAHRGHSKFLMFRKIEAMEAGDSVIIRNFRETLEYRVVLKKIVYPDEITEILIQPNQELVTLMTCHPYPTNLQRYLVYCERVNN